MVVVIIYIELWAVGLLDAFSTIFKAIRGNKIPIFWYCYDYLSHCTFAAY